jgi:hypothetical protein
MKIGKVVNACTKAVNTGIEYIQRSISEAKINEIRKVFDESSSDTKEIMEKVKFHLDKKNIKCKMRKLDRDKKFIDNMD